MEREVHTEILKKIANFCIDIPEVLDLLDALKKDYVSPSDEVSEDVDDFKSKYDDLKSKYIERFFSSPDEVKEEQSADVKKDGEKLTFDELFEERVD